MPCEHFYDEIVASLAWSNVEPEVNVKNHRDQSD